MADTLGEDFTWVVPEVLAAMSRPRSLRRALEFLKDRGISVIVSLTESRLEPALVEEFGFDYHHLPLEDFTAPSYEMVQRFIAIVNKARNAGKSTVVHCMAGLGRSGTMAACYLVSIGYSSREALDRIRALRPGSVETVEQEEAVHEFAFRFRNRAK